MSDPMRQDAERLKDALRILRDGPVALSDRGREILGQCASEPIVAICAEMERTVLRRALLFTNDREETLTITVADRRVLGLETSAGEVFELSTDNASGLQKAHSALAAFCDTTRAIAVQSQIVPGVEADAHFGVLPQSLATAPRAAKRPDRTLPNLLEALRTVANAYVVETNQSVGETWGSADLLDRIQICLAQEAQVEHPCTIWVDVQVDGMCFGYLQFEDATVWMVTTSDHVTEITSLWSSYLEPPP